MARLGHPVGPPRQEPPGRITGHTVPTGVSGGDSRASQLRNSSRPPRSVAALAALNASVTVLLFVVAGTEKVDLRHYVGAAMGMFVSVVLMGWFRQRLALCRSDGRFLDWRFSSSRVMTSVTTFTWLVGIANLFVICYELSRKFTS